MSHLFFMDESGHDLAESPYEVLAGISIEDRHLWSLVSAIHGAEEALFGQRVSHGELELKAKKLLKRKVFRLAQQMPPISPEARTCNARACLVRGAAAKEGSPVGQPTRLELTALAQAKIAFAERVLDICTQYRVRAFASIIDRDSPRPQGDFLRKDYAYLFERFFYFLEDQGPDALGLVVFDELERVKCHILVDQMARYFRETATGRMRASRVIPEPFFVHSELTTAVQVADIVAYLIAWGVRVGKMCRPARAELSALADRISELRYRAVRRTPGSEPFTVWSFALIDDLRPREEKV